MRSESWEALSRELCEADDACIVAAGRVEDAETILAQAKADKAAVHERKSAAKAALYNAAMGVGR